MNLLKSLLLCTLFFVNAHSFATSVSLEDKIGQMLIIGFEGKTIDSKSPVVKAINKYNIGGVILFDFNSQTKKFDKNIESPEQVKHLNQQLQLVNKTANIIHHRKQLPLLISVDYEGGKVTRLKEEYGFPATISAQEMGKMPVEEVDIIANNMAKTLKKSGFNLDFAPVLDVNINPENPVIGKRERSFSGNPAEVSTYAHLFSEQFIQQGSECAYKHFPGHGSANADSHLSFVDVTDTWQEHELIPYQQLLAYPNHCGMVMTAHIVNRKLDATGVPATLSHAILTGILRKELNFDGVIVTDDMQMRAISDNYGLENALTLAINAGADMLIFGNQLTDDGKEQDPQEIIDIIANKVAMGEISEERINEAYKRIIHLKKNLS
jgi:beta-N-acetylhexosaminidase